MNKLRATCPPFNHVVRLDPATKGSHNAGSTGVPSPKERCTGLTFAPVILIRNCDDAVAKKGQLCVHV